MRDRDHLRDAFDALYSAALPARPGDAVLVSVTSRHSDGWVSPATEQRYTATDAPAVTSTQYPEGVPSGGPGVAGTFVVTARQAGAVQVEYYLDGAPEFGEVPVGPDGKATITWTPTAPGTYTLHVTSRNADFWPSDTRDYQIVVAPPRS